MLKSLALGLSLAAISCTVLAVESHWPAFLGADADERSVESLPLSWGPDRNIAWLTAVDGHGQSSPVLWGERVFLTSVEGPEKDTYHTYCLNVTDGDVLWQQSISNSAPVKNSYYVSRAAPTPIVDSERLVAFFESGDCVAYDHDGHELWRRDLAKDEGPLTAEFGLGASPCQSESAVFILLEHEGPSCLLAIDKSTGQTLWKSEREPRRSWSSPSILHIGDTQQVVVSSAGSVDGYDVRNGDKLWGFGDVGGNTGTTPIDCGDGRFLVGASPGRQGENQAAAAKSNCLMQVVPGESEWTVQKRWLAEGATPSWASPIVHRGLAYWVNRVGVVYCFDAESGEPVYAERLKQSCWATPYGVGDRVYFFGKDGLVTVLAAGREFHVLAENTTWTADTLPEEAPLAEEQSEERRRASAMFARPTLYGYAVSDDAFLIRVGHALICVR